MAGNGPPPVPTKRRRNADPHPTTVVVDDGTVTGPELPEMRGEDDWHPMTARLWEAMRRSPLMRDIGELGWLYLVDTMLMHHTMWAKGRWEYASELRLRMAQFGITPADRLRLRIQIVTPKDDEPAAPTTPAAVAARRRNIHIAG